MDLMELTTGSDDEIAEKIHEAGTDNVLDAVFTGMQERFQPDKAGGVDAQLQWLVADGGDEHPYTLTVKDGTCETGRGRVDDPRVTLTTDVVSFAKLMAGKAPGPVLYMSGKLEIQGDLMIAQRMTSFFEPLQS
jgi:putative sterol carrier protein